MNILEMKDKRSMLLDQNEAFVATSKKETRKLSEDEDETFKDNLKEIGRLDAEIKTATEKPKRDGKKVSYNNVNINYNMNKNFSLIRAINDKLNNRNFDEATLSVFTQGMDEMRRCGQVHTGSIVIPLEYRGDILAGTEASGQEIVAEEKKAILPPLTNKLMLARAGATFLTNLVGNVSVPSYSGTTVNWKDEAAIAVDGAGTFSEVNFTPMRLTAFLDVSKLFLAQDAVGAERLLLDNIATATAIKLESTILGVAAGSTTQPQGMGYKTTTGLDTKAAAAVPTYATMVGLETTIDTSNALIGNLSYITNGGGRGILKSIVKTATYGDQRLLEDGLMNGYPVYATNSASAIAGSDAVGDLLVFGNWADLCICQWGGYDITVDPYTVATYGKVRIVINAYFDAKGLRGTAVTDNSGGSDPDNYAISFASMSLKLS